MALPRFARSADEGVIAGVCAGIAQTLGVDATLVRLVFALLALAGGAGILLYLALWAYGDGETAASGWGRARRRRRVARSCTRSGFRPVGRRHRAGRRRARAGLARRRRLPRDAPLSFGGLGVAAAGAVLLLSRRRPVGASLLAPGAIAGALLLIAGPWLWRLALERDAERAARIRSEERAEVAARVHDSVLQTLALIQRHAAEPRRVAALARRQERELRGWLYGDRPLGDERRRSSRRSTAAAADVEELHGVRVELASVGRLPGRRARSARSCSPPGRRWRTPPSSPAPRRSTSTSRSTTTRVAVFVRDRGAGFDRGAVPARPAWAHRVDRRADASAPADARPSRARPATGTEVELTAAAGAVVKRRVVLVDDHELFRAGVRGRARGRGRGRRRGRERRRGRAR